MIYRLLKKYITLRRDLIELRKQFRHLQYELAWAESYKNSYQTQLYELQERWNKVRFYGAPIEQTKKEEK